MIVDAIQYFQMEVHGCTVGNGIEEFTYHLCIHLSDPLGSKGRIIIQIRSAGQVNGAQSQGLIHRKQKMPIAFNTFFLTKGFLNRLSEHNSGIFNGMMTITLGILFMILPMTSVFIIDYIIASYFLVSGISLFIETIPV